MFCHPRPKTTYKRKRLSRGLSPDAGDVIRAVAAREKPRDSLFPLKIPLSHNFFLTNLEKIAIVGSRKVAPSTGA